MTQRTGGVGLDPSQKSKTNAGESPEEEEAKSKLASPADFYATEKPSKCISRFLSQGKYLKTRNSCISRILDLVGEVSLLYFSSLPSSSLSSSSSSSFLPEIMLSNHIQNGIETAKLVWSRLPSSEDGETDDAESTALVNGRGDVESLDYEIIENYAYREEQVEYLRAQRGKLYTCYYVMVKWSFSLLIGIGTGLAAIFINLAVENFAGWKFSATFSIIQSSYIAGFFVYVLINLALVLSSVFIVTEFAPAAAGSGIPEIKGYLNGVDTHGILLFRTLIGKIFGSIGSVGGGLALGKEGPLVHTGACIASLLGQGGSTKYHLSSRWLQVFKSERDRRDLVKLGSSVMAYLIAKKFLRRIDKLERGRKSLYLGGEILKSKKTNKCGLSKTQQLLAMNMMLYQVTCGCAAGVAAAFRAPVGGVLFALEEVEKSTDVACLLYFRRCGCCGTFCYWVVQEWKLWSFWLWRFHNLGHIREPCLISLPSTLLAGGETFYIRRGIELRQVLDVWDTAFDPCPASEVECPRPPGTDGNYVNDDAIRNLFSAKTFHEYSAQSLLAFLKYLVMFYSLAVVTFGTAVPAGQFIPGIMIGSTYGRLVGMFVVNFYQKLNVEEGTYALLGAASFLGGSMRMTVSLCVIMVEITNNLKLLPLIMLVLLISKAVGDAFNEGLYEEQARVRNIPLLESRPKQYMRKMTAKEACRGQKVVYLSRVIKVADIVVDRAQNGEPLVIGLILRR
ncbi:hypothetical protein ACLOJK_016097 [Asimina triloba]